MLLPPSPLLDFLRPSDLVFGLLVAGFLGLLVSSRDRLRTAGAVYVVSLPLVDLPAASLSGVEALNLFGLALAAMGLTLAIRGDLKHALSPLLLRTHGWLWLFLGWAALGCWRGGSWDEWWRLLRLVLTALAVRLASSRPPVPRTMATAFVATMSVLSAVGLVQFGWGRFVWSIGRTKMPDYDYFIEVAPGLVRAPGTFADPNNMGIFAGLALVLVAFEMAQAPPCRRRRLALLGLLLLGGMACSLTRSAAAASGLALAYVWVGGRRPGRLARAVLPAAVLVLALVTAARWSGPAPSGVGSLGHRLLYWKAAALMAVERPLLGVGLGRFGERFAAQRTTLPPKVAQLASHKPHSFLLHLAAETGLVGLLFFCVPLVGTLRALLARCDPLGRLGAALLGATLLHAAMHNVLGQDLLWLVLGVAAALGRQPPEQASVGTRGRTRSPSPEGRRREPQLTSGGCRS